MINATQKKHTVTAYDNRCNKIELNPEISKEIDEIVLLPSKKSIFLHIFSQTWKNSVFTENKLQVYQRTQETKKEI